MFKTPKFPFNFWRYIAVCQNQVNTVDDLQHRLDFGAKNWRTWSLYWCGADARLVNHDILVEYVRFWPLSASSKWRFSEFDDWAWIISSGCNSFFFYNLHTLSMFFKVQETNFAPMLVKNKSFHFNSFWRWYHGPRIVCWSPMSSRTKATTEEVILTIQSKQSHTKWRWGCSSYAIKHI